MSGSSRRTAIKEQTSSYPHKVPKTSHVEPQLAAEPVEPKELGRPTPCTVLALCTVLFLLVVLIFGVGQLGFHEPSTFLYPREPTKEPRVALNQACDTRECIHYSSELMEVIDTSVNPCDDFYAHVCAKSNPGKRRFERLRKLMDASVEPEHPKAARVVRRMLSTCAIDKNPMIDGWKRIIADFPFPLLTPPATSSHLSSSSLLTSLLINLTKYTPEDVGIFGIQPSQDSELSLFVVKPKGTNPSANEIFSIFEILKTPGVVWNTSEVEEKLDDVVRFQTELMKLEFDSRGPLIDLRRIQSRIPIIDWQTLVDSWYHGENGSLDNKIFGFNTAFYEKLTELISSHKRETLFNFLLLRFSFVFLRPELERDRHEACLQQISTTIPGKIVIHGSAEPESEKLLVSVLVSIQEHLELSVKTLEWMESTDAMKEAQRKFQALKFNPGFRGEDAIDELRITSKTDYLSILSQIATWQTRNLFKSIAEDEETLFLNVDVFYSVEHNTLTISRALLHYPYISSKVPLYINFATVSSLVLPQLIHVFDERGRFYDSYGRHRDWWIGNSVNSTEDLFRVVLKCFYERDQHFLGVSITVGLNAYNSTEDPYMPLPGQTDRKDVKLFFYSIAKNICDWDAQEMNNALKNVPQFHTIFECRSLAEMYSDEQCKLAT